MPHGNWLFVDQAQAWCDVMNVRYSYIRHKVVTHQNGVHARVEWDINPMDLQAFDRDVLQAPDK